VAPVPTAPAAGGVGAIRNHRGIILVARDDDVALDARAGDRIHLQTDVAANHSIRADRSPAGQQVGDEVVNDVVDAFAANALPDDPKAIDEVAFDESCVLVVVAANPI